MRLSRSRTLAAAILAGLGLHACASPTEPPKATTVTLNSATIALDAIGATGQLSVTVADQKGQPMVGLVPTYSSSATGVASVSAAGVVTAVSNGAATITANVDGATATATVTVAQVPVAPVAVSGNGQIGTVLSTLSQPVIARAVDRLGTPIPNATITFTIISGGGSLDAAASVTTKDVQAGGNGEGQTTWRLGSSATATPRLTASVGGQSTLFTATATGGPPAQMRIAPGVEGNGQRAKFGTNVEIAPAVQLLDADGNPVAGRTVTFAVQTGGGSVTGASAVTNASGVAAVGSWTLGAPIGEQTLRATFESLSFTFTATAIQDPCVAEGATPITVPDTVIGSISDADCSWTPPANTSQNSRFDLYRFDLASRTAIIINLTKQVGIVDPYLFLYNATTGVFIADNDDIQDGVIRDSRLTITLDPGAYMIRATTWEPNERGTYALSVTGCRAGEPVIYRAKAGNGAVAAPGATVPTAPSVEVLDECGNGVSGVPVTFATVPGVGSITGASATTNASGVATLGSWTLAAGPNVVSATLGGAGTASIAPVIFSATGKASTAGFDISLRFVNMPTANQLTTFGQAATRWETIITGDLSNIANFSSAAGSCNSPNAIQEALDDLIIIVRLENIDGAGAVLGSAGPCLVRTAGLTALGSMRFDTSDLPSLEAAGSFGSVILHEMGHVLGIGTLWNSKGFLQLASTTSAKQDTHFNGPEAIAGFNVVGGTNYTGAGQQVPGGAKVPVENCTNNTPTTCGGGTINSHWREGVLKSELMTGYLGSSVTGNPLSVLTIGSLKDIGYVVDLNQADSFFEVMSLQAGLMAEGSADQIYLQDDIERHVIREVRPDGRIVGEPVPGS
ncbi:MAG: leishmanolysin-related zinc metalloendopeptidase, partial [Gemmatimonadota bacterium]|nr:leishmanolysin-related zinc metalloendopeptidase [Gemmatimonadota bacterium]MDQ8148052.1 leishmanolysin-related zinc metalloendopeptidase [Gemmatimonadota bacterium]MDQ8149735.1 leishmanolysin-related zinc metalloendopeptidase [Gemmatimonadota bacterium]MDQ8177373.1 leishmanolysin-related zinc metalloendopeptidase [Gemmatimonadota bacterium]